MGGSTKVYDTTPKDTAKIRGSLTDYLSGATGQLPTQVAGRPGQNQPPPNPMGLGGPGGAMQPPQLYGPTGVQMGGPQPNQPPMIASEGPGMMGQGPGGDPSMGGYGGFGVGNAQGGSPYDRIFAQMPSAPGQTQVGQVGGVDPNQRSGVRDVGFNPVNYDGSGIPQIGDHSINPNQLPQIPGQQPGLTDATFNRGQIRDVGAQNTQSVDSMGGKNSAFFNNMVGQLQPSFDQQRALALASGKEAGGNLTGSGMGNIVGGNLGRTLGSQQAQLADYATQGIGMEVGRQAGDANRQLQAGMANQGADAGFMQNLLQRGQLGQQGQIANQDNTRAILQGNQQAGLQGALANQGVGQHSADQSLNALLANQGAGIQTGIANQGQDAAFQSQDLQRRLSNQGAQIGQNQFQGNLDQQRQLAMYSQMGGTANQNAQNYMQLLMSQGGLGVSPNTVVSKPGLGQQLLSGAIQLGSAALGHCHVAEELYGKDDIRTHRARAFVATHDTPFTRVYKKLSLAWAALVRQNPKVKPLIQPIWDEMAMEGAA